MSVSRNAAPKPEIASLATGLEELLKDRLPTGWAVRVKRIPQRVRDDGIDGTLEIRAPGGTSGSAAIEFKRTLGPASINRVIDELRRYSRANDTPVILVASYVPIRARQELTEAGINYADLTGNIALRTETPAVFIRDVGLNQNPWRSPTGPVSLRGASAARVVRALCDFTPPIGIRVLGSRAGVSAGYVSKLLTMLERDGLVERAVSSVAMPDVGGKESSPVGYEQRGPVTGVDWRGLVQRWTSDYSFTGSNISAQFLDPRGVSNVQQNLGGISARYALTGAAAAARVSSAAPILVMTAFTPSIRRLSEQLQVRRVQRGGNLILAEPFSDVVYERGANDGGLEYVSFSQALADLRTTPGRAGSEAEVLEGWMAANEPKWRLRA